MAMSFSTHRCYKEKIEMSITLQTVASGYNLSAINANFQSLQTALNSNILWRNGSVAGEAMMTRDLDMNGNAILNIGVDLDNPDSLLTLEVADARYYNVTGDVLEGNLDAGQHQLKNLQAPTAAFDATRKQELDAEIVARQGADASLQEQLTGEVPLEASAFSEISWHGQRISNSVNIPANKNAWSFGPQMEIVAGQAVTIGAGSSWTIADGRLVEDEDLHHLIADTITTTDGNSVVNVNDVATASSVSSLGTRVATAEGNITSLSSRMTAEENKVQPVLFGGTGATDASGARTNLGLGTLSTQSASSVAITGGSISGITDLAVADGGTGASTAAAARANLGAASSSGVTDASNAATGGVGEVIASTATAVSLTSGTVANIATITLTPGDWDVHGSVAVVSTAAITFSMGAISLTSGAIDLNVYVNGGPLATSGASNIRWAPSSRRVNVSANTTVYLLASCSFASGTATVDGQIHARRAR